MPAREIKAVEPPMKADGKTQTPFPQETKAE